MNAKQRRFCDEYLIDLNAVQAALRAGYSESTAKVASRWIDDNAKSKEKSAFNPEMAKYIADRMASKDAELIASQDEVLQYLTRVMRRQESEYTVQIVGEYAPVTWIDARGEERSTLKRQERPELVEIPTPISAANKAAELLGRRYAMFTDNVVTEVELPQIIEDL